MSVDSRRRMNHPDSTERKMEQCIHLFIGLLFCVTGLALIPASFVASDDLRMIMEVRVSEVVRTAAAVGFSTTLVYTGFLLARMAGR